MAHFLVVVGGEVKSVLDGKKSVIIVPGASQEELERFRAAVEAAQQDEREGTYLTTIAQEGVPVSYIEAKRVKEVRGG